MSFLRVGTVCVVTDGDGAILLSRRGDTGMWSLPGGRVDHHETLYNAALREVREETGIDAEIVRPVGLFYKTRWERMNVLFLARMSGGTLAEATYETTENRFFAPAELPDDLHHAEHIQHALAGDTVLKVIDTPLEDYRALRLKFAARWVENLVRGNPEPRYPRFTINAVGLLWDSTRSAVLNTGNHLPRVACDGESSPWTQLAAHYLPEAQFSWVGVWQDTAQDIMEFVFSAIVPEGASVSSDSMGDDAGTRILLRESPFDGRDATFVRHARPDQPVWMIDASG